MGGNKKAQKTSHQQANQNVTVASGTGGTVLGQSTQSNTSTFSEATNTKTSKPENNQHNQQNHATVTNHRIWTWQESEKLYDEPTVHRYFNAILKNRPDLCDALGGDAKPELLRCLEKQGGLCRISSLPFDFSGDSLYSPEIIMKHGEARLVCRFVIALMGNWKNPQQWKKFAGLIYDKIDLYEDEEGFDDDDEEDDDSGSSSDSD